MPEAQFKDVEKDDLKRLNEMVNDAEVSQYLNLIPPLPMEKTEAFFKHVGELGGKWWCIINGGKTVGSVGLLPDGPGTKLAHSASFFIYLVKEVRGRGFGKAAMEHMLSEGRKRGYKRVQCTVVKDNRKAVDLYLSVGFEIEGIKRRAFKDGVEYHDMLVMGMLL